MDGKEKDGWSAGMWLDARLSIVRGNPTSEPMPPWPKLGLHGPGDRSRDCSKAGDKVSCVLVLPITSWRGRR